MSTNFDQQKHRIKRNLIVMAWFQKMRAKKRGRDYFGHKSLVIIQVGRHVRKEQIKILQ